MMLKLMQCDEYTGEQGQILAAKKADRHTAVAMALLIRKPATALDPRPYLWDHLTIDDSVWLIRC